MNHLNVHFERGVLGSLIALSTRTAMLGRPLGRSWAAEILGIREDRLGYWRVPGKHTRLPSAMSRQSGKGGAP